MNPTSFSITSTEEIQTTQPIIALKRKKTLERIEAEKNAQKLVSHSTWAP
jgi:hypothetical protein